MPPAGEPPALPTSARVLDAVAVVSLVGAETFAAIVGRAVGQRWTVSPLYAVALLLFLVRHWRWPAPSLLARVGSTLARAWRTDSTRRLVLLAVATRVAVLAVGYLGATRGGQLLAPANFRLSHNVFWNLPARYDAGWYLGIARNGYEWWTGYAGQQNVVFFPGFPLAMRIAGDLVTLPARILHDPALFGNGNTRVVWGGALVAIATFTLALVRVGRYGIALGLGPATALRGAVLLACAPFAYFFSAPYSEGLFLLATVSTFAAWRAGCTASVAGWGLVAGFTRSNGWTLSAALVVDALMRAQERGAPGRAPSRLRWRDRLPDATRLASTLTPLLAAVLFSIYVYWLTGHPLTWMTAQQAWGNRVTPFGFATARWGHVNRIGFGTYVTTDPGDAATVVCVIGVIVLTLVMLARRQWLEATFSLAYLLPGMALDIPSLGRMTSVLFPAYLALASLLTGPASRLDSPGAARAAWRSALFWVVAAAMLTVQLVFAFRFFGWRPPY